MTTTGHRCWRFPSILKAVGTSLQPGRLVIGLLVITVLVLGGQIWDGLVPATVSPRGLEGGMFTEHALDAEGQLRRAVLRWGSEKEKELKSEDPTPTPVEVLAMLSSARSKAIADGEDEKADKIARTMEQVESFRPRGAFEASVETLGHNLQQFVEGATHASPGAIVESVVDTVYGLPSRLWHAGQCWFLLIYGLFLLLVIGVGGGSLARMEACQISADERLTMFAAMHHAIRHWWAFWMSLVIPLLLAAIVCGVLLLIGLVGMNIPVVNILVGVLYGLALLVGFLLVFLLLGYALGGILLVPAVAVEHCDGGDAMQRAWAYILNKPLHMLGYILTAMAGLVLGLLVVNTVALLTVQWTAAVVDAATFNDVFAQAGRFDAVFAAAEHDPSTTSPAWSTSWTAGLVSTWVLLVWYIVAGWMLSYIMAASTRIYLLMRRACDGQDEQLIWWDGLVSGSLAELPDSMAPHED